MRRTIATIAITAYAIATLSISAAALTAYDRQELSHVNALADQNPGFESGTVKWSGSPALTINSNAASQFIPGSKQFAVWDSTSSDQEVCSALVKVPESGNCAVSLTYKVPSGTATHKIVAKDGSKDLAVEDVFSSTAAWRHDVEFPCAAAASNQARVCLRSVASNEPAIQLDGGYAGEARQVSKCGVDTPAVSYTPTGSWTNNTTYSGKWWRRGDRYHYEFQVALSGQPNSTSLTVARAPGLTIDTSKLVSTTTDGRKLEGKCKIRSAGVTYNGDIYYNGTSNTAVVVQNVASTYPFSSNVTDSLPGAFTNGDVIICEGSVPIVGWEASQCVTPNQQRAPKITHYLSGSGTHTWSNGVTHATIEIIGGGGGGGGAGTSSTAGGAGGQSSFDGVNAPGGTGGGNGTGGSAGSPGAVTAVPCTTNETFMCRGGARGAAGTVTDVSASSLHAPGGHGGQSRYGGAGLGLYESSGAAAQANTGSGGAGGAGDAATYYAGAGGTAGADITWHRVAPSGSASYTVGAAGAAGTGTRTGGAGGSGYIKVTEYFGYTTAILANSVSSSVVNGTRIESAAYPGGVGSCGTIAQIGDWIQSCTRNNTGNYTVTFKSGIWSSAPQCQVTPGAQSVASNTMVSYLAAPTTSSFQILLTNEVGTEADGYFSFTCHGSR